MFALIHICINTLSFAGVPAGARALSFSFSQPPYDTKEASAEERGINRRSNSINFLSIFFNKNVSYQIWMSFLEVGTFWNHRWPWLVPTSEFLFWFKVESRGLCCHAVIGFLTGLFIPLWLSTGNSFKTFIKAFVILMVSKPEHKYLHSSHLSCQLLGADVRMIVDSWLIDCRLVVVGCAASSYSDAVDKTYQLM